MAIERTSFEAGLYPQQTPLQQIMEAQIAKRNSSSGSAINLQFKFILTVSCKTVTSVKVKEIQYRRGLLWKNLFA